MAENQLLPFAHADDANVTSFSDWSSAEYNTLRQRGFQSGIAKSDEVNRAIAQGANTGYAVGELIKDYAGENATIKPTTLYSNFKKALEYFFRRQVIGFIYPVGSIYTSTVSTNPATLFGVGQWQRIGEGRGLIDAGSSIAAGSTGGSATHTITVSELPAHSHGASSASAGNHAHSGSTNSAGNHQHGTGWGENCRGPHGNWSGSGRMGSNATDGDNYEFATSENGAHSHSVSISSDGSHTHSISVQNTGGGAAMSVRNPYLAVYIWKRVA